MTRNWPVAQTQNDWMRQQEKRTMHTERRPNINSASDLLGPGFGPTAIEMLDWNAEEAAFNGFFWSGPGAINSPDSTVAWLGFTISQDNLFGVQRLMERDGGREFVRRFWVASGNTRSYTPWLSASAYATGSWAAYAATSTTLANATWTPIPVDTTSHDDFVIGLSSGTYPGGFTAPAAGVYRASGAVVFGGNTLGTTRGSALLLNAGTFPEGSSHVIANAGTSSAFALPVGVITLTMALGDVLRLQGYQSTGASLATTTAAGLRSALFVQKIG